MKYIHENDQERMMYYIFSNDTGKLGKIRVLLSGVAYVAGAKKIYWARKKKSEEREGGGRVSLSARPIFFMRLLRRLISRLAYKSSSKSAKRDHAPCLEARSA